jgi:anti-sigma regulatory factor (Ser/Thr protein kinase)
VSHEIRLPANKDSAGAARRFARSCLADSDRHLRDDVVLVVSELVTNSVEHAGPHGPSSAVRLHLEMLGARLRVEVSDQSTALPTLGDGDIASPSGRGLLLVERLARRWGVVAEAWGKTVWLEIDGPDFSVV